MIRFNNDYNQGAHPAILSALQQTNETSYAGYGEDEWCEAARKEIRKYLGEADNEIYFMIGGTQVNYTVITAALRPYQSVISADCGHINNHEAGSIEHTGHKVLIVPAENGKLTAKSIADEAAKYYEHGEAEYLTQPKMVFLSSPSEFGTTYKKEELMEIRKVCDKYGMYMYVDGARMGYWLTSDECDVTLADLAEVADLFYIGGTKCGALLGEALVIINPKLRDHFKTYMKQSGGVLAKGWLLGLQFYELFKDGLYFEITKKANEFAMMMKAAFEKAGMSFYIESGTNQQFVVLTKEQAEKLAEKFVFEFSHDVDENHVCVRFCTSWSTTENDVKTLVEAIKTIAC